MATTIKVNTNLAELFRAHESEARYRLLIGGTRSGKTWAILEYLITLAVQTPDLRITIFRQDSTRHTAGAMADYQDLLRGKFRAIASRLHFNSVDKTTRFPTGSVIRFAGAQDIFKAHGPAHDILFLNEVNEMSSKVIDQLDMRTRVMVIADCNPVDMEHPFLKKLTADPRTIIARTTYRDNPHLSPSQVAVIEGYAPTPENIAAGTADKYLYEVYTLGKPARREGAVYENWEISDEWPARDSCQRCAWGLDLGFATDPTALICARVRGTELFIREYLYEYGLLIAPSEYAPEVPSLLRHLQALRSRIHPADFIYSESSQPESLTQLRLAKLPIIPATKGPGSIIKGINRVKRFKLRPYRGSTNLIGELRNYTWRQNPNGSFTDAPVDRDNHALDALRYAAQGFAPLRTDREISAEDTSPEQALIRMLAARRKPLHKDPEAIVI